MKMVLGLFAAVSTASLAAGQTLVGALAIDEGWGDQYGWAVDDERARAARQRALSACASGCSVVLTFERCAAYAADQEGGSSAFGWAESYGSSVEARQRALSECGSRGGSGCTVRVWGCNGPVVEGGLGLDRAARREVQEGLQAAGFDPGGVDGGGGAGSGCITFGAGDSWRDPGFRQTNRHPVTCVSWDDAQEYVSWLSRRTGASYRLPTEAEWERAAAGSQPGCDRLGRGTRPDGTCPVGSYGPNAAGLSDMEGNLLEWTSDCWEGDCGRRVLRGGSWSLDAEYLRPGVRGWLPAATRLYDRGFRVLRTLD